uniref:Glutamine synthetase n=1 Tax=candidate division WOR-3 bacterium TaxID=2052148 RepID=A0A7V3ZX06_UNCW3
MQDFVLYHKEEVLEYLKDHSEVKFCRFLFVDVLGRLLSFTVPSKEVEDAFNNGKGFDGSSVEGFARIFESDLLFIPDPKTFRVLPWKYELAGEVWYEALMFGDIYDAEGNRFEGDSRYALMKTIEQTREAGEPFIGPEIEFFLFENDKSVKLLDAGGYFYSGKWGELRKLAMIYLEKMGIPVECDHHEVAPSQHEIDLKYENALETADRIMLAKYVLKRTAERLNLFVSFMPKPVTNLPGNGMHLHISLFKNGENRFYSPSGLSDFGKRFAMGLIKYGKEIQLVLNQWVNSYKRLRPGYEAPCYLAWGTKNRSLYIRVPNFRKDSKNSYRIELRSPDPACNPYLAFALILKAGLKGVEEGIPISEPQQVNVYELSEEERILKGIENLNSNLKEALELFKSSQLCKEVLGEHIHQKLIENKEKEWESYISEVGTRYENEVSEYEIDKYLPIL